MIQRSCLSSSMWTLALSIALLPTTGCGKKEQPGGAGGFQMPPTPVEVAVVERTKVVDSFHAVGTLEAVESVGVAAEIEGMVVSLPFAEGQSIRKGQPIAVLDDSQLRAEVRRAEAVRDQQRTTYDRMVKIVAQHVGSEQQLDDVAAALAVAEANLEVAATRLAKTRIVAPFDGIAGARNVSPGAFLRPGDVITTVVRLDELKVSFAAPERYLPLLASGTPVAVRTTAFPADRIEGRVDIVEPSLDPETRNIRILARVQNATGNLKPGMSADVSAVLAERDGALTVPSEAVFAQGDKFLVYAILEDGTVARRAIELGTRLPDAVEVVSGLDEGTRVVRTGHQKLFDGAKVQPITAEPPAPADGDAESAGAAP